MPDLAATIEAAGRSGYVGLRTGTVTAFSGTSLQVNVGGMSVTDPLTLITTIQGGTEIPGGVPYLASYSPTVGDSVVLASAGSAWLCLGRVITPPSS